MLSESKNNIKIVPLWQRIAFAITMFVIFGAVYVIFYGFWVGMSGWADMKPSDADTAERFYLTYIWGGLLIFCLILPVIFTLANTRWLVKWLSWFLSAVFAFAGWVMWFAVIEITSK